VRLVLGPNKRQPSYNHIFSDIYGTRYQLVLVQSSLARVSESIRLTYSDSFGIKNFISVVPTTPRSTFLCRSLILVRFLCDRFDINDISYTPSPSIKTVSGICRPIYIINSYICNLWKIMEDATNYINSL